jgi:riboflavin synthase
VFTGIVQAIGTVRGIRDESGSAVVTVAARLGDGVIQLGESIAVDGVCLTVETVGRGWFQVRAAPETLRSTTLGGLRPGAVVNLERSLRPTDRLGGHLVFGHVDGVATLERIRADGDAALFTFSVPDHLMRYLVEKGCVTLGGVSLTVFDCARRRFTVSLVPHTLRHTTLGTSRPGTRLNLETDMLARYVERCVTPYRGQPSRRRASRARV